MKTLIEILLEYGAKVNGGHSEKQLLEVLEKLIKRDRQEIRLLREKLERLGLT